tara:strand:- start:2656 stop:3252 length:597 start_codon:yes stop_codon:yes gene_type:complete
MPVAIHREPKYYGPPSRRHTRIRGPLPIGRYGLSAIPYGGARYDFVSFPPREELKYTPYDLGGPPPIDIVTLACKRTKCPPRLRDEILNLFSEELITNFNVMLLFFGFGRKYDDLGENFRVLIDKDLFSEIKYIIINYLKENVKEFKDHEDLDTDSELELMDNIYYELKETRQTRRKTPKQRRKSRSKSKRKIRRRKN